MASEIWQYYLKRKNPVTAALSTVGRWIEEHPKTSAVIAAALGAAAAGASRNVTPPWSKPGSS